jgi:2-desacetyl-2-hydroxyethyl bacteriochlorophyllide A dehydrogenase
MEAPQAPIAVRRIEAPPLEEGAILLDVVASEVCGTDVHLWHGRLAGVPYPIVPGHVSVGRIAAFGSGAVARDLEGAPFRPGDVVTFCDVVGTCHACWTCLVAKETTRCPHRRVYGITLGTGDGACGGWAERMVLRPGTHLLRLPDGLDAETFIGGGCGAVTAFHAVQRAGVRLGDTVVVLGAGPVGQSAAAFAALSGAGPVIVVGAPDDRLRMARRMGADDTVSIEGAPHTERREAILGRSGGRGADVVIEATGVPQASIEAMTLARDGGTVVIAGHYTDAGETPFNPHAHVNRRHLEVRGCWGSDVSHFHGALAAMARHRAKLPWREMVTRWYGLEECDAALRAVAAGSILKAGVRP